jgi:hypothetical protein
VSLDLWGISEEVDVPLQPLAALQRLTSLTLRFHVDTQQARVLAGLGQLRRLVANFGSPAAAAAAELARLEECEVDRLSRREEPQGGALVQAPGQLRTSTACLAGFDLSSVHTLQLKGFDHDEGEALRQQLSRCPQLCALYLTQASSQPELLQAIVALPQLQHLCLRARTGVNQDLDCGRLAVLAGCRQLRQLTLEGMADLPDSALLALMVGPLQLRLMRLLGCSAALSQERCQALVGQLGLYELQVDVVVKDRSGRAQWMMEQLAERWREVSEVSEVSEE